VAITTGRRSLYWLSIIAGIILGLIFITAGLGKILHPTAILDTFYHYLPRFAPYFLTSAFTDAILVWLPRAELVIGLLMIVGVLARLMSVLSLLLTAGFIANNVWLLNHGQGHSPCGCLGAVEEVFGVTLSATGALYMDLVMMVLALVILLGYRGTFLNPYPWFLKRDSNG